MRFPILISIRGSSTRLPGKAFADLAGRPAVERLVRRMSSSARADGVVVCTSTNPADDELAATAQRLGVECVRGSEADKLERYRTAADALDADFVLVVDGDDLLCDPLAADAILAAYEADPAIDYAIVDRLPLGATPFGVRVAALKRVCELKRDTDTEVWGSYFTESGLFEVRLLTPADARTARPELRLTLDYPEDLELLRRVHAHFGDAEPGLAEAIEFIDAEGLGNLNAEAGEAYATRIATHGVSPLVTP